MKQRISPQLRARLLALLNARSEDEAETDELFSVLLQLSLAVMMIFMIAFFLFTLDMRPKLAATETLRQELNDSRQQRLFDALEKVEQSYALRYRLNRFFDLDQDGKWRLIDRPFFRDGKFSDQPTLQQAFAEGGAAAFSDFGNLESLRQAWHEETLAAATLRESELPPELQNWLASQIEIRLEQLRGWLSELQTECAAQLLARFAEQPQEVQDSRIRELLTRVNQAEPAIRPALLTELSGRLKRFVYDELRRRTDTPLLIDLGAPDYGTTR